MKIDKEHFAVHIDMFPGIGREIGLVFSRCLLWVLPIAPFVYFLLRYEFLPLVELRVLIFENFEFFRLRYLDLQNYDGRSGNSYFAGLLSIVLTVPIFHILIGRIFLREWVKLTPRPQMKGSVALGLALTLFFIWLALRFSISEQLQLSESDYSGMGILAAWPFFLFFSTLIGAGTGVLSLQFSAIVIRGLSKRG